MPSEFDDLVAGMNDTIDDAFGVSVRYWRPSVPGTVLALEIPFSRTAAEPRALPDSVGVDAVTPRLDVTAGVLGVLGTPGEGDRFEADGATWQVERVVYVNSSCDACLCSEVR